MINSSNYFLEKKYEKNAVFDKRFRLLVPALADLNFPAQTLFEPFLLITKLIALD